MSGLCERCGVNQPAVNDDWCPDCVLEGELALAQVEELKTPEFRWRALGTNGQYTLEDLERRVAEYEDEYGLPSDALLAMNGDTPPDLPYFDRHVWLSYYREILELRS